MVMKKMDYKGGSEIIFETAWRFPEKIIERLSEMYPDADFQIAWADECIGSNVGEVLYVNSAIIEHDIPTAHRKEAYEMSASIQEINLSEMNYFFNEQSDTYEYQDQEEQNQTWKIEV